MDIEIGRGDVVTYIVRPRTMTQITRGAPLLRSNVRTPRQALRAVLRLLISCVRVVRRAIGLPVVSCCLATIAFNSILPSLLHACVRFGCLGHFVQSVLQAAFGLLQVPSTASGARSKLAKLRFAF